MDEDVVIELKIRFSGLTHAEAKAMRDTLRGPNSKSMLAILGVLEVLGTKIAPDKKIEGFSPWAEWRPARGKRKNGI